ncbi:MAG: integrase [Tenacibaculum sp.]|nr:integrase [Tenacibaculum sp.]
MATIKYKLYKSKKNTQIYLRLSLGRGKSVERKTGLFIKNSDWSTATGLPKQNTATNKNLTTQLQKLEIFTFEKINNTDPQEITGEWLQFQIDLFFKRVAEHKQSEYVTDNIQYIIDHSNIIQNSKGGEGLGKSRIQQYKRLKVLFENFEKKKKVKYKIKQLNKAVFDEFKKWLSDNKYEANYYTKKASDLKTVCNNAKGRGVEVSDDFHGIKTIQAKTYGDDENVITLTLQEIEKIEQLQIDDKELNNARKWLIMGCFIGQRGGDLLNKINKNSFKPYGENYVIELIQQKGNKPIIIPVSPRVKVIFDNGLPYSIHTQKLNKLLKKICKMANIDTPTMGKVQEKNRRVKKIRPKWQYIGTHTLRRTFATLHYGKIPTPYIMSVTGHKKESTFLQYINQSETKHIEVFNEYFKKQETPKLRVIKNVSNG